MNNEQTIKSLIKYAQAQLERTEPPFRAGRKPNGERYKVYAAYRHCRLVAEWGRADRMELVIGNFHAIEGLANISGRAPVPGNWMDGTPGAMCAVNGNTRYWSGTAEEVAPKIAAFAAHHLKEQDISAEMFRDVSYEKFDWFRRKLDKLVIFQMFSGRTRYGLHELV